MEEQELEEDKIDRKPKRRLYLLVLLVIPIAIFLAVMVKLSDRYGQFDSYEVVSHFDISKSSTLNYTEFNGGLVSYSQDGASYLDAEGVAVWNEAYDMQSPKVRMAGQRLLIYDTKGTTMKVLSPEKEEGEIQTNLPIVRADVAADGTVAAMMQEADTGYLNVYKANGTQIAQGQVHLSKSGYPMDLAISEDGKRLAVSMASVKKGVLSATINIYDFSEAGEGKRDNLLATFHYGDSLCPEIEFFADGSLVAYSNHKIHLIDASSEPKEEETIRVKQEIKSVMTGEQTLGFITDNEDSTARYLHVYSQSGKEKYKKKLDVGYTQCRFLTDEEILITNKENLRVYNKLGGVRFSYDFTDGITAFLPTEGRQEYLLIYEDQCERIKIQ
ncbi:MAG: DUF5711 family protein [Lachnospiraceae bacterium]|nr:DUF5711 family protein [Lachnospiraceae bacterium]